MKKELFILIISWTALLFLLIKYIPKDSRRYFQIVFLFGQAIAWIFEYSQVVFGLLEFPYREFEIATKMSFSLHYVVLPTFGVFFILLYPLNKSRKRVVIHYLIFGMASPTYIYFLENYSSLIHFIKWNWLIAVFVNFIILYIIQKFAFWFKKGLLH
ncbi:CBO0543 family protein [Niallia sp. NCCP-28]|uniref:CBO0543 family protein n=1 Tax=Niallia sp. NCCP-28 TaxID=2934712 RepID=UPI00208ACA5B|nr:CBO0543 family protein [Niallia sp. NCCP-28]GKU82594.1 hypothetical protein NCCP28_19900 [Niallia sp. NCCP-28]